MAGQFREQGGAATMDPSAFRRWATSRVMTRMCRPGRLARTHSQIEAQRKKNGAAHIVEYFHQVDDGYSYLAAQVLPAFAARYDIELVCHLVSGPSGKNAPEPDLLLQLSRYDAHHVASAYGLVCNRHDAPLADELVQLASRILAHCDGQQFIARAADVGRALWADDEASLQALAREIGEASSQDLAARIKEGDARRTALRHYSGGMFYYGDEWYWGVDRLYHLEHRLSRAGADRRSQEPLLAPRPATEAGVLKDAGTLTLEVYPSLRSPYTAISFDGAVQLARDTGVKLVVRPVLPMVMRGVPATRQKGMYIFTDAAREATAAGVPFGNFYDPIGEPARRGYSLYPWAEAQGKGVELISTFLRLAFAEGVNLNTSRGLKKVVEQAGLNWQEAQQHLGSSAWEAVLESNRSAMYAAGLWGVPSFRLLDEHGEQLLALWGQDRLWLFAREIQRQLASRQ